MGNNSRKGVVAALMFCLAAGQMHFSMLGATAAFSATPDLSVVRSEINAIERDLLQGNESQASASGQLKKIRKLLALQQKEIQLSRAKVKELSESMQTLSTQKQALLSNIEKQKAGLKLKLRELDKLTQAEALDASWLTMLDVDNQKSYYLAKTLKKELAAVESLKKDVQAALALELKILEEKNKLDYYVQELHSQMSLLGANEQIQSEIFRTNRANRLEALRRMKSLKDSEREIESMISSFREPETVEVTLAGLKGKLPFPVEGQILSGFGKSFNPKTNLLTFQKGITLGAKPSSDVKAVSGGKVVFAGPLKNYGLVVILEHPGQYYTLYGQLGSVGVALGGKIGQGGVVGRTNGEPLYFEIRDKNVAINPVQWLSAGDAVAYSRN